MNKRLFLSRILLSHRKFSFNGKKYSYFLHPYNSSFANERAVEVAIIKDEMDKAKGKNILEVGNVLSHYIETDHLVLDKYEKASEVINEDIIDFNPSTTFDLIVSISTFEHVGYDEKVKDPEKIINTLKHLKRQLNKGGKIVFTVPIDYNKNLSKQIQKNQLPIDEAYFLKRTSRSNKWEQTTHDIALTCKYGTPYANASAVMVGVVTR